MEVFITSYIINAFMLLHKIFFELSLLVSQPPYSSYDSHSQSQSKSPTHHFSSVFLMNVFLAFFLVKQLADSLLSNRHQAFEPNFEESGPPIRTLSLNVSFAFHLSLTCKYLAQYLLSSPIAISTSFFIPGQYPYFPACLRSQSIQTPPMPSCPFHQWYILS